MNAPIAAAERVPQPAFASVMRVSLLLGWLAGTGLTFYGLPHALLHDEWDDHGWRVAAATRALKLGPLLYLGPIIVAPIVGAVAHRGGYDTRGLVQRADVFRRAKTPFAVLMIVTHCAIAGVFVLFAVVVNTG